jgi:asparagine synthase (glutamine-hydrolysing)
MCGFVGWANHKKNLLNSKEKIIEMTETLSKRGPDSTGYYESSNVLLGHKRLAIIDTKNGKQPMTFGEYTIVYNGELYNAGELKNILIDNGFTFKTKCDTEILLKAYIHYREKVLDKLEGIFAFAVLNRDELFIARDRLGVKPLFYSKVKNDFIFASEIKAILKSDIVKPIINKRSICELLALGPSHTPGSGVFKDIYELKPGYYMTYKKGKIKKYKYWDVKEKDFTDTFEECTLKTRNLLEGAIERQLVSDVPIATLLSGGVDSSIITAICANKFAKEDKTLETYSIDYEDNSKYFKKNDFQVAEDKDFIEIMKKKFNTIHYYKVISQRELADTLKEAVIARDMPGMADIDSSLYWFSKEIKNKHTVVLSGECADEIFGGYPWFYKKELLSRKHFPWISSLSARQKLLSKKLNKKVNLDKYALKQYKRTIKEVPKTKDKQEQKYKNLFYLNIKWFMTTLLERKDRMTMRASIEARVPFSDHNLIEYLWNVPWKYKFHENREKGLLREAFKDIMPEEVLYRKKNPYPKTHNPIYANIVSDLLRDRISSDRCRLFEIFDEEEVLQLINSQGDNYKTPWFGQLMTGPQLIAYLYQFDIWMEEYDIILKI